MSELDKAIEVIKEGYVNKELKIYNDAVKTLVSTIEQLRETLNKDIEKIEVKISKYPYRFNQYMQPIKDISEEKQKYKLKYARKILEIIGGIE